MDLEAFVREVVKQENENLRTIIREELANLLLPGIDRVTKPNGKAKPPGVRASKRRRRKKKKKGVDLKGKYKCTEHDCTRSFPTIQGRSLHIRRMHRQNWPGKKGYVPGDRAGTR